MPFINRIISPPLRPVSSFYVIPSLTVGLNALSFFLPVIQVNSQVIRPQEKALMSRLVDIMASLELRFVQERAEDGQLTYRLDPYVILQ